MKRLLFYGPTGKGLPSEKIGGGERGCLRTLDLYHKLGVEYVVIEKPTLGRGKVTFLYNSFVSPFILIFTLLKNPQSPVHIVGFYEHQLFYEYMMFLISKLFGRKIVYELRNGTMVKTYNHHSWLYKIAMKNMIEKSEVVLCQGLEFVDFIHENWKANTIYYPNYVMNKFLCPYHAER